jgi:hypothetical protein
MIARFSISLSHPIFMQFGVCLEPATLEREGYQVKLYPPNSTVTFFLTLWTTGRYNMDEGEEMS